MFGSRKKVKFPNQLLFSHNNKPSGQVKMKEGEVKKIFWRRET